MLNVEIKSKILREFEDIIIVEKEFFGKIITSEKYNFTVGYDEYEKEYYCTINGYLTRNKSFDKILEKLKTTKE